MQVTVAAAVSNLTAAIVMRHTREYNYGVVTRREHDQLPCKYRQRRTAPLSSDRNPRCIRKQAKESAVISGT